MSIIAFVLAAQLTAVQPASQDAPPKVSRIAPVANRPATADATALIAPEQVTPIPSTDETAAAPVIDMPIDTNQASVAQSQASPSIETARPENDIVVTGKARHAPGDPLEGVNVQSYAVVQAVDEAVTGPIALTYKKTIPSPVRSGLRNFLSNLFEPVVSLNYLLQLKAGKSAETLGRFAVNSTVGVAGLFDVAKKRPFNLPRRANGFGNTLGYYGFKPGPFLYLPLMGPTTVRDLVGRIADVSVLPLAVGSPFSDPAFAIPTTVVRLVDERAEADEGMHKLLDGAANPYATVRADYLRTRQAEIDALHRRGHRSDSSPAPTSEPPGRTIVPIPQ